MPQQIVLGQSSGSSDADSMKAAHVKEWCDVGTVPDSIVLGDIPAPPAPVKRQVVVGVKATAINVDDIAALQDTAGGGWCFHYATPKEAKPLRLAAASTPASSWPSGPTASG